MANTVILGSGIVGVSIAYYLADHQPPDTIHLVDPAAELFLSGSGFAGGFLAKDWFSEPVAALGALSFDEHRKLAEEEGGREKWGYAASVAFRYSRGGGENKGKVDLPGGASRNKRCNDEGQDQAPHWLRRMEGDTLYAISKRETTAQLDPRRLSQFLLQKCLDMGIQLHQPAKALSIAADTRGELATVRIGYQDSWTETDFPCTRLVIAAGAWSTQVFLELFRPNAVAPEVGHLAGYSILVREPELDADQQAKDTSETCHGLYCAGDEFTPYVFSRLGGGIYVAGLNPPDTPLPLLLTPNPVIPSEVSRKLEETATAYITTSPSKQQGSASHQVIRRSLCFRPVTASGLPILGRVPDKNLGSGMTTRPDSHGGVFFAAGHGSWGISLCLGTGKVMSEVMQGRRVSVDIRALGIREV